MYKRQDQYNDFGKFYYRSAESILETLKPLLAKHELLQVISDEIVLSGDWHYIKATVTVSHGEESLSVSALAREQESKKGMDESQITGTASSLSLIHIFIRQVQSSIRRLYQMR